MRSAYSDRSAAGRELATALRLYRGREDLLVLAVPRGGVPVGFEIARELGAPLDVLLVRKLGAPGHEELALGAVGLGGTLVLNPDIVRELQVGPDVIGRIAARESAELRRQAAVYRGNRALPDMEDRCVILTDDGLATGATMRAGISLVRKHRPAEVVVAVPVAPPAVLADLRALADDVVCPVAPADFQSVGRWYGEFLQATEDEVRAWLARAAALHPAGVGR